MFCIANPFLRELQDVYMVTLVIWKFRLLSKTSYTLSYHRILNLKQKSINRLKTSVMLQGQLIAVSQDDTRFTEIKLYNLTAKSNINGWVNYELIDTVVPCHLDCDLKYFTDFREFGSF